MTATKCTGNDSLFGKNVNSEQEICLRNCQDFIYK
jgi:hypothetical protein